MSARCRRPGIAQPTVSNHLKVLEEAGLVRYRKDGLWVNYFVTDGGSSPYAASLLGNLKHWLQDEPEVIRIMESLPGIQREDICRKDSGFKKETAESS